MLSGDDATPGRSYRDRVIPRPSDLAQVRGVFGRVQRDRQVSNLLYGLLGWEDELDPQAAIGELAESARRTLFRAGPDYLERVAGAAHLLIEMVLDVARAERDAAVVVELTVERPALLPPDVVERAVEQIDAAVLGDDYVSGYKSDGPAGG